MYRNCSPNFYSQNPYLHYNFNQFNRSYYPCHQNVQTFTQDNSSQTILDDTLRRREADEEYLKDFLNAAQDSQKERVNVHQCKISEAKSALIMVKSLNQILMKLSQEMKNKNLSEAEWTEKRIICEETKSKMESTLQFLKRPNYLDIVKRNLKKRKNKRLREKRINAQWKRKRDQMKENRIRLHNEADNWIKSKQNIIDKEKQDENLRKDVDVILFDVTSKRGDVKKYTTLLKELENLRRIKVTIAKARGEYHSSAADEAFNNIIDKLSQQWAALDREYSIEEQGLNLMIKTDNELKIEKQKKNPYESWEIALFGKKIPNNYFLRNDLRSFIIMRSAWDKFLNTNEGTPIPMGWIVPNKPSSAAWQKCLKKE